MASIKLRRFAKPQALKRVQPDRLVGLLDQGAYRPYFESRGIHLRPGEELDYDELARVLMEPTDAVPPAMIDALYHIDEMSTDEGMNDLIEDAGNAGLELESVGAGDNSSPADVAVEVWLKDKELLLRAHAKRQLATPRSFEYFQAANAHTAKCLEPTPAKKAALERDLDEWFVQKNKGPGTRVFIFPSDGETWFLVCHGGPLSREGVLEKGKPSTVLFRPEQFDTLVYDEHLDEMRVKACGVGEKKLFLQRFGFHFFGDEGYFPSSAKFTGEPLRERGKDALACDSFDEMEGVTLTEIQYRFGGGLSVTYKSKDLLSDGPGAHKIYANAQIAAFKFKVKFVDSKTPRTVAIRPPNISSFARDEDAGVIDRWLQSQGFSFKEEDDTEDAE